MVLLFHKNFNSFFSCRILTIAILPFFSSHDILNIILCNFCFTIWSNRSIIFLIFIQNSNRLFPSRILTIAILPSFICHNIINIIFKSIIASFLISSSIYFLLIIGLGNCLSIIFFLISCYISSNSMPNISGKISNSSTNTLNPGFKSSTSIFTFSCISIFSPRHLLHTLYKEIIIWRYTIILWNFTHIE